jgi:hypothetical protein
MKKAIVLACAVALLLAMATMAFASTSATGNPSQWILTVRSGILNGTALTGGGDAQMGFNSDGTGDGSAPSFNPAAANIQMVNHGSGANKQLEPFSLGVPYSFDLVVGIGTGYVGAGGSATQVYLAEWAPDKSGLATGWTLPTNYSVTVKKGVSTLATYTYATTPNFWVGTTSPAANKNGGLGFWYTYDGAVSSFANSTDILTITVAPNTPEPGSLLALGSGLMGLAGFAIRRRRA